MDGCCRCGPYNCDQFAALLAGHFPPLLPTPSIHRVQRARARVCAMYGQEDEEKPKKRKGKTDWRLGGKGGFICGEWTFYFYFSERFLKIFFLPPSKISPSLSSQKRSFFQAALPFGLIRNQTGSF